MKKLVTLTALATLAICTTSISSEAQWYKFGKKSESESFKAAVASNDLLLLEAFIEDFPNSDKAEKVKERIVILEKRQVAEKWIGRKIYKDVNGNSITFLSGRYYYNVRMTGVVEDFDGDSFKVRVNDAKMTTSGDSMFARRGFNNTYPQKIGTVLYWKQTEKGVSIPDT